MTIRNLFFLAFLVPCFAAERFEEKTFDVEPGVRFSLDHYKGHIRVRTDDRSQIQIKTKVYLTPEQSDYSEKECQKVVDAMEVLYSHRGNKVSVDLDQSSSQGLFSSLFGKSMTQPYVDFEIILPDSASLKIDSYKGSFDIHCPSELIDFETYKGTGHLSGVRSDFKLETYKGELEIDIEAMKDIEAETYKGDILMNIQGGFDFTLIGETYKGDFKVLGLDTAAMSKDGGDLYLKEGKGTYRVDLETYKGVITLKFQD